MCPELPDATLVEAAQRGDSGALNALLRRHHDRIYRICRRMAGNDADAADATQEALIAIAKGLERFRGGSSFSTWSYRVASNACLDELRRRGRRPVPVAVDEPESGAARRLTVALSPSEAVVDRMVIDDALAQLPDEFLAPVVLRDQLGLDYAEIAAVLDIAPGTVRSRIARGRRRLATILTNESDDSGNQTAPSERPTDIP